MDNTMVAQPSLVAENKLNRFLEIVRVWVERDDGDMDELLAKMYAQSVLPAAQVGFTQIGVFTSQVQRQRCIWWDSGTQPDGTPIYIASVAQSVQLAPTFDVEAAIARCGSYRDIPKDVIVKIRAELLAAIKATS